jgi:outer membrane protein
MKKIKILATALVLMASAGMVQAQAKIAHINSAEIMEKLPAIADVQKTIEAETTKYTNLLSTMEAQIKSLETEIQGGTLDEMARDIKLQEYQDAVGRYQKLQTSAQESLSKLQTELINPIITDLKKTIVEVAKENGYDYVLDSAEGGIMIYGNESFDLMGAVKKKLNLQ